MFMTYFHTQLHTITITHFRTKYFNVHSNNKVFQVTLLPNSFVSLLRPTYNWKEMFEARIRLLKEKLLSTVYIGLHKNEKEFTYQNTARDGSTDDTRRKAL